MTLCEYGILLSPLPTSASGASSSLRSTAHALPQSTSCMPIYLGRLPRLTQTWWRGQCMTWGKWESRLLVHCCRGHWWIVSMSSHTQKFGEILKKCCPKLIFMSLTCCKLQTHWNTLSNSNTARFVKKNGFLTNQTNISNSWFPLS